MGDAARVRHHLATVARRWRVIAALAVVGLVVSGIWSVFTAGTTWSATTALTSQSADRGPDQDAVLALGYVNYFNQDAYQEILRGEAKVPADVSLSAELAATSPIMFITATGPDEQAVRTAATSATETFRNDIRANLQTERQRTVQDMQRRVDQLTRTLGTAGVNDGIVSDQIRSLQGRITDLSSTTSNQLNQLQPEPGVSSSSSNPVLGTAAGGAGGAVVGILVALLLGLLDRRVHSAGDIRFRAGLSEPVFEIDGGAAEDGRRTGNLLNAVTAAHAPGSDGRGGPAVLAVVAPRAGTESDLARRLAVSALARGTNPVLVEVARTTSPSDERVRPGLVELLTGAHGLRTTLRREPSGLNVLGPGDPRGRTADVVDPRRMGEVMAELRGLAGLVVVDTPPLLDAAAGQAVCASADHVLLVVESGVTPLADVTAARELLEDVRVRPTGVVLVHGPRSRTAPVVADRPERSPLTRSADLDEPTHALPVVGPSPVRTSGPPTATAGGSGPPGTGAPAPGGPGPGGLPPGVAGPRGPVPGGPATAEQGSRSPSAGGPGSGGSGPGAPTSGDPGASGSSAAAVGGPTSRGAGNVASSADPDGVSTTLRLPATSPFDTANGADHPSDPANGTLPTGRGRT